MRRNVRQLVLAFFQEGQARALWQPSPFSRHESRTDGHHCSADSLVLDIQVDGMHELTLKHFVLKQQVINLYRQAIRASRGEYLSNSAPTFQLTPYCNSHTRPYSAEGDSDMDTLGI